MQFTQLVCERARPARAVPVHAMIHHIGQRGVPRGIYGQHVSVGVCANLIRRVLHAHERRIGGDGHPEAEDQIERPGGLLCATRVNGTHSILDSTAATQFPCERGVLSIVIASRAPILDVSFHN